jgi:uncharacterized protein with LGFP repeats
MASSKPTFRFRKAGDINRDNALFELLADEVPILDVGFANDGTFEVAFNKQIGGKIIPWTQLQEWIEKGKAIASEEK